MKKIIYLGTPQQSANILSFLFAQDSIEVVAVVTNPDKPVGRKKILTPSPVKQFALDQNIPVYTPEKFTENEVSILSQYDADFFIIVAYGTLIPQNIIDIPKEGTFNLHFSLLPKYRGATPIQSAILAGEEVSGISVFSLVKAMDAGDIFIQEKCSLVEEQENENMNENINQKKTQQKNHAKVWNEMIKMGQEALKNLITHFSEYSGVAQDENKATFCGKFTKSDGEISPEKETATEILQKYNGFFTWPGIFLFDENQKRIKILELKKCSVLVENPEQKLFFLNENRLFLQCNNSVVEVLSFQKEGKKPVEGKNVIHF